MPAFDHVVTNEDSEFPADRHPRIARGRADYLAGKPLTDCPHIVRHPNDTATFAELNQSRNVIPYLGFPEYMAGLVPGMLIAGMPGAKKCGVSDAVTSGPQGGDKFREPIWGLAVQ